MHDTHRGTALVHYTDRYHLTMHDMHRGTALLLLLVLVGILGQVDVCSRKSWI